MIQFALTIQRGVQIIGSYGNYGDMLPLIRALQNRNTKRLASLDLIGYLSNVGKVIVLNR